jgi:predicted thioesterase
MENALSPGIELSREWTVSPSHLYNPTGLPGRDVLSSPSMIMEMEQTCARLAKEHLPAAQTTVGFHVDVKHIAPSKPGALIVTTVQLESVDGKKLTFKVEARDGGRVIGVGRHRRAVIAIE